ncbi:MAG TPA: 50S ribosomal protein L30 [Acidimicrobiia bacterium]|jgi:large subunit ribosomal protein L30|nr:50S ribosomal protein L30 [Acidimicrobiia bacterium]
MAKTKDKTIRVTLRHSLIGEKPKTRATIQGLGLKRLHQTVEQTDSPTLRGMLAKVRHLVEIEETDAKEVS